MASFSQSRFAAILQNFVSRRRYDIGLYREIAEKLSLPDTGVVLDVGTGSGLQLKAIHEINTKLILFGLDISAQAIRIAQENLFDIVVNLHVGSIEQTRYDDNTFDIVTCNSSMSYWKNLHACFDEIYRILKPGGYAKLYEPQKDFDLDEVTAIIKSNLADKSPLRRFAAVQLNKFGLRRGSKLGLKLYSIEELLEIVEKSAFTGNGSIDRVTLQNLPIFICVTLYKPAGVPS